MARPRLLALPLTLPLVLCAAVSQAPAEGCSKRSLACKDFDSCSDASTCPGLRCACDGMPAEFEPVCGNDGTCFTTLDCPELCTLVGSKCSKPPTQCSQFSPTQCDCSSTTMRFAAAWDCTKGTAIPPNQADCNKACAGLIMTGGSGGGSGTSVATATSTLAATTTTGSGSGG